MSNVTFEREDWMLFQGLQTLGQKAGVPLRKLGALVVKEIADNALDAGASAEIREEDGWVIIEDDGPGIDPGFIPTLFSIRRPLTSSKIVRLPQRGALGNGLRVVMGAVYASKGEIIVESRGIRSILTPQDDGSTVAEQSASPIQVGTRVSLKLGPAISVAQHGLLAYAQFSSFFATLGTKYVGKTSPWWYDSDSFFGLLRGAGTRSLKDVLLMFRDIKSGRAEDIIERIIGINNCACNHVERDKSADLLVELRKYSKEVKDTALGRMGPDMGEHYAAKASTLRLGAGSGVSAQLPYVVEVACHRRELETKNITDSDVVLLMVNRTPIVGDIHHDRSKPSEISIWGCGLSHRFDVPKDFPVLLTVNVTIPYMPITTDGKEPDMEQMVGTINQAIKAAAGKCKRDNKATINGVKLTQKDFIERFLNKAIAKASDDGSLPFSLRQLYYAIRPFLLEYFEKGLDYNYFATVITQIESDQGHDIKGMYRDARGVIYHPHTKEEIPLGTLAVADYKRPAWTFNKILYIEKKGFFPLLQAVDWPERNDCALMTSQGFASRAARDVIDLLGDGDEDIYFFCIHDADAAGTMIYQSLMEATKARARRRVHVINLGLEVQEALDMGLEIERFREEGGKKMAVADYVDYDDRDFLQTQRVELNAMDSRSFLDWLDAKFAEHVGKVVPPGPVLEKTFEEKAFAEVEKALTDHILKMAHFGDRRDALQAQVTTEGVALEQIVREGIELDPVRRWDAHLDAPAEKQAQELVEAEK